MSELAPAEADTPPGGHPLRAGLRDLAARFPEAHEAYPWGQVVVKVQKKVFVFLDGDPAAADLRFSLKLPAGAGGRHDRDVLRPGRPAAARCHERRRCPDRGGSRHLRPAL
jgi:hypothetical protein